MPQPLSRAWVVRRFRPRSSVSSTAHSSHILIRCSTRRSTTRRATVSLVRYGECSQKKGRQTPHRRDFPDSVIIPRERHPFEGCALAVIGSIRRGGVLFVLACLPDGSRALIPAQWTDWDEDHCGSVRACREANVGSAAFGRR